VIDRNLSRVRSRTWAALAVVALAGVALVAFGSPDARANWQPSYLIAWLACAAVSFGSLSILLLHNLTGGRWGSAIRPVARAAAQNTVLIAILSLPVLFNLDRLYPWTNPSLVAATPLLRHKQLYLNPTFFQIRTAVYFAIWIGLLFLLRWHDRHEQTADEKTILRMGRFSGQGLLLHGLATTFAAIDWLMSLEPEWFSTIYGVMVFIAQGLAALAFCIIVVCSWSANSATTSDIDARHDLGKLLLAFVMLWTYMAFSQFLIIWYGNLPEEVVWYSRRLNDGWQWIALSLVLFKFAIPFILLLSRTWKRSPLRLRSLAAVTLFMTWVELVWLVAPPSQSLESFAWMQSAGLMLIIGTVWCAVFLFHLVSSPVMAAKSEALNG
jgi:hypothetical protein